MAIADDIQALNEYLKDTNVPLSTVKTALEFKSVRGTLNTANVTSNNGSPQTPIDGSITTSYSDNILAENNNRVAVLIHNHSQQTGDRIKIHCGQDASSTSGLFVLDPQSTISIDGKLAKERISAIALGDNSVSFTLMEFVDV